MSSNFFARRTIRRYRMVVPVVTPCGECVAATTRSLASASSVPPPSAVPFTAAMVGLSMKWCT